MHDRLILKHLHEKGSKADRLLEEVYQASHENGWEPVKPMVEVMSKIKDYLSDHVAGFRNRMEDGVDE